MQKVQAKQHTIKRKSKGVECMSLNSEQILNAAEKDIGREPLMKKDEKNESMMHYSCPACGNHLLCSDGYKGSGVKTNHCPDCGEKLDWSKVPFSEWL